jgi:hypothetical protein
VGAALAGLLIADVHSAAWMATLATVGSLPINLLNVLTFNRKLLKGIATTFQTVLVCGYAAVLMTAFSLLYRNQPFTIAAGAPFLPSFMLAAFMDAYPEEGRVLTSRIFFTLNLVGLLALAALFISGRMRTDEFVFEGLGGLSLKASELLDMAIKTLVPFALRNLFASFSRPQTLAVRQADVVCIEIDDEALRVLLAVHAFLTEGMHGGSETPGSNFVLGAIGAAVAAL